MLTPSELLDIVEELNCEIEDGIEGLCQVDTLSIETNGDITNINLFGGTYWNVEEEEINSSDDLKEILHERLTDHKKQVDGMLNIWKPAKI